MSQCGRPEFKIIVARHMAEWTEFDLDGAEWRIPDERMKMRDAHIVPLSTQSIAILIELRPLTGRCTSSLVHAATGDRRARMQSLRR